MSIRTRIVVAVVAAAALATILFAAISVVSIDRVLRTTLDTRLRVTALAVGGSIDVIGGRPHPDADDLGQTATLRRDINEAIVDLDGRVLAGDRPPVSGIPVQNPTFVNGSVLDEPIRLLMQPIVRNGRTAGGVLVWRSSDWIDDVDRAMLAVFTVLGLAVIGLGVLFARLAADKIVAPIERIAALAARIEAKDLSLRLRARGTDELARLASSFDHMIDRLQESFETERRFAADASHDLRAPLTVLRAETELALRQPRSVAEYRKALEGIAIEAERLETLVNDLLVVARADVDAAAGSRVDVFATVASLVGRVDATAKAKGVALTARGDRAFAIVDPDGLERTLMAILHNAIAFAVVCVTVGVRAGEQFVTIEVSDDGPGFSLEALRHATERFWRADGSRPRGGTGLGLSIAQTIVEANGGTMTIEKGRDDGGVVTVSLRAASATD